MRLTREQTARNRRAILETAARLFRARGFEGVAVADIMAAAGFTHGGFYNHFPSKAALAAEVCAVEIARSNRAIAAGLDAGAPPAAWRRYVGQYLSREHRDRPAEGCTIAALAADAGREGAVQESFAEGIEELLEVIAAHLPRARRMRRSAERASAIQIASELVGAIVLSRAVASASPALADEILEAARRKLR